MAWAIFNGKDVENRTWSTKVRGRVKIQASKKFDREHYEFIWLNENRLGCQLPPRSEFVHGAIIGEVDIIDCVDKHDSPWFTGPYGFVLANPVLYAEPIPCKGRLGFFAPAL
ncbi:hypothetical protein LCGC14_0955040 [marine sediment metagenome]|uniref:ASCH domain-containing protein n=1 Tax=marine sediment metagenome TaxID=412755 RepID=A0A0F9RMJ1_9ZZZZ